MRQQLQPQAFPSSSPSLPKPPHSIPPHHPSKTHTPIHSLRLTPPSLDAPKQSIIKLSRRDLAIIGSSLPPLFWAHESLIHQAHADAPPQYGCDAETMEKKAFLDVSIDGEPAGRITIGLYTESTPIGSSRFLSLVTGTAGISYRRKEFVKIMPNYVQHGGVRSYGVDAELARSRGADLAAGSLVSEWEKAREKCGGGVKNVKGSVGIVVRDPQKPPPKMKLAARKGKLEIYEEAVGPDPNGTEFVIAAEDASELDASTLVVGRVLDGMEVVQRMLKVKTVQENTSSPYFRVAKLIGDKRAVVAEKGFNRPYSKVIITNCGMLE